MKIFKCGKNWINMNDEVADQKEEETKMGFVQKYKAIIIGGLVGAAFLLGSVLITTKLNSDEYEESDELDNPDITSEFNV